jgi:transcriptional regulator NrdR family protein
MSKTVTIQVDCPKCHSTHNKMLSEKDKWDNDNSRYFKVGKFQCLACDHKFTYTYGIEQE